MPLFYMSFRYSLGFGWEWLSIVQKFFINVLHLYLGGAPEKPIKFLLTTNAKTALNLFILTLALTPLHSYVKINLLRYRRLIGLFGAFYLLLHVSVFVGLKHHFDLSALYEANLQHPFLIFGELAFLIILMMSVTSLPFLFKRFASWHKLFYPAMVLVMLHFLLAQKQIHLDDIVYATAIALLLALKLLKR